jgi:membrane protein implicated in regulation of membrane protease activity
MHVMIILMLLPLLALPVFWFLPLNWSIPIYVVCVLVSASMFWLMRRSKMRPAVTGAESLVRKEAEVVSKSALGKRLYMVRAGGELWTAQSRDIIHPGQTVTIVAVDGNRLTVERKEVTHKAGDKR